jgi:alkylation response protein AidB-like acyl-CoA dehydrogenase
MDEIVAAIPCSGTSDRDLMVKVDRLADELSGSAAKHDADSRLPSDIFLRLHEAGLLGLTVPAAYGGRDADLACAAAVVSRIAQGDASVALILAMQYIYVTMVVHSEHWPVSLRRQVGQAAARDGALFNAFRAEPELGTPARGGLPGTTAYRVADGWRIVGRKIYATGGELLNFALVWAKTDEAEARTGFFVTPLDAPGVTLVTSWDHIGMRATGSHTFVFDNVALPLDHSGDIRATKQWVRPPPIQEVWNNVIIAALYDGIAQAARRWLIGYLKTRVPSNLGAALATLPRFHEIVGEMDALLLANNSVLRSIIERSSRALAAQTTDSGLAKYLVTTNAVRVVELGVAAIGNAGLSRTFPLERFYRDVLCSRVHVPQNDMVLSAAGRAALM